MSFLRVMPTATEYGDQDVLNGALLLKIMVSDSWPVAT